MAIGVGSAWARSCCEVRPLGLSCASGPQLCLRPRPAHPARVRGRSSCWPGGVGAALAALAGPRVRLSGPAWRRREARRASWGACGARGLAGPRYQRQLHGRRVLDGVGPTTRGDAVRAASRRSSAATSQSQLALLAGPA